MTTQVSIDRDSLSLTPLVIGTTYSLTTGMWLPPEGLSRPGKQWARNYATSRDFDGAVQTDARLEQTAIALSIYLAGVSTAEVEQRFEILENALSQFTFDLTVTVDDQTRIWSADCADVTPADYTFGMVQDYLQLVAVSIPVHPITIA